MGCISSNANLNEHLLFNFHKTSTDPLTSMRKMEIVCNHWKRVLKLQSLVTPLVFTIVEYARLPFLFDKRKLSTYNAKNDYYTLLLVGGECTGKSSMLLRFAHHTFRSRYIPTRDIDLRIKRTVVNYKADPEQSEPVDITLLLCDCGGQFDELRHSVNRTFHKSARGVFLVFDITNLKSFEAVRSEYKLLSVQNKNKKRVVVMLIGTKCDLEDPEERQVSVQQAQRLTKKLGLNGYMEVSSKENINITLCFRRMVETIYGIDQFAFSRDKPWMYPYTSM